GGASTCVLNQRERYAVGKALWVMGVAFINIPFTPPPYLTADIMPFRCAGTTDPNNVGRHCFTSGDCPGGSCVDDTTHIQPCPICNATTHKCNGGASDVPGQPAVSCTPAELTSTGDALPTSHD